MLVKFSELYSLKKGATQDYDLLFMVLDASFGKYEAGPDFNEFGGESEASFVGCEQ